MTEHACLTPRCLDMRTSWLGIGLVAFLAFGVPVPASAQVERDECDEVCTLVESWLAGAPGLIERFQLRAAPRPVRERAGWSPPRRIVIVYPSFVPMLQYAAPDAEIVAVPDTSDVAGTIAGADVYIGRCTPALIEAGVDLKWVQIDRAGAETCASIPAVAERGILVTNLQRILSPAIADHALALMYALARELPRYDRDRVTERWSHGVTSPSDDIALWEVEGKTMFVVGLGGIGTEIARKAHGLGMRVVATRNSSREGPDFVEYVGLSHEAVELAAGADVVVNALPLTDATRGLFDAAFFAAMKETAVFVNIGRGESVVTGDLVTALQSGHIAGAGLDVSDPEPLPPGHPLWHMQNVVLTPHIAGVSDGFHSLRASTLIFENLRRYIAGEAMLSVVDLRRGY